MSNSVTCWTRTWRASDWFAPGLTRRTLEAVERMAICVRVGLPEDAHLVTAKIGRYLAASGETLAGPSREVFLQPPNPERMHESVVEMQFAIQPSEKSYP